MAWTKKTGTIPDKVTAVIVVDTSDGNLIKDLGASGCVEDTNLGTVTFDSSADTFTVSGLATNDRCYFFGGTMPTGLSAIGISADVISNVYYVVNSNQLSATSGGSAINFTTNGSGVTAYKLRGITPTNEEGPITLTKTDRTTGAWGTGFLLSTSGAFDPHRLMFTDMGSGAPKIMTSPSTNGYTQIMLANRLNAVSDRSLFVADNTNIPAIGYETSAPVGFALKDDVNSDQVVGTTDATFSVPLAVAATGKRHASQAEHRLYYAAPTSNNNHTVSGSFSLEAGPTQVDGIGNTAVLRTMYWRGQANFEGEYFLIALADTSILTSTELNTIMNDPLGTLVNQPAVGGFLSRNFWWGNY